MKQQFPAHNLEEAIYLEATEEQENSFYDVFPTLSEREIIAYKRQAGIPIVDPTKHN